MVNVGRKSTVVHGRSIGTRCHSTRAKPFERPTPHRRGRAAPLLVVVRDAAELLRPTAAPGSDSGISPSMSVCSCENVAAGALLDAVAGGCSTIGELKACTAAGTGCGGCLPDVEQVLLVGLEARGGVGVVLALRCALA